VENFRFLPEDFRFPREAIRVTKCMDARPVRPL
jgi:hypothetical protein